MNSETRLLLKKRAAALVNETSPQKDTPSAIDIVSFTLSTETYGIEAAFVKEIYAMKDYTPLPGIPSFIPGITSVRGRILAIVNLKKFFDLPESGIGELNKVIIISNEKNEFGILADTIGGSLLFDKEKLKAIPFHTHGQGSQYIKGINEKNIILLDAEKILSDNRLVINDQIL